VAFHIGELVGLTAAPIEHPHLRALCFARPTGREGQISAVGAPARRARGSQIVGILSTSPAHVRRRSSLPSQDTIQRSVILLSAVVSTVETV